ASARAAGLTTSVDAASAAPLMAHGGFLHWVRGVDLLIANADEAFALAGPGEPPEQASKLAYAVGGPAVVKMGRNGALWAGPAGVVHMPVQPAHVVDATGAGDAFAAGLL